MNPHAHALLAGGRACCPLHLVTGWPGGFPGDGGAEPSGESPASFRDGTPKQVSAFCDTSLDGARDLFERPWLGQAVLIRGATLLPMDARRGLPGHDILIRNGHIEALAPRGRLDPAGAIILEGAGKYVLPGLSDVHTHPTLYNSVALFAPMGGGTIDAARLTMPYGLAMLQYLVAGVTRIAVMAGSVEHLRLRELQASGRIDAPVIHVATPLVDAPNPMQGPAMSWMVSDAEGGRQVVRAARDFGYDFIKPYSLMPAESFFAMMKDAVREGVPVLGHVPKDVGIEAALAAGMNGIAHVAEYFYWEAEPARSDPARLDRLVRATADAGAVVQATIIVSRRLQALTDETLRPQELPDREYYHPLLAKIFNPESEIMSAPATREARRAVGANAYTYSTRAVRRLVDAGVMVLAGTDVPNPFICDGWSVHEELQRLVEDAGLLPWDALESATRHPAIWHGDGGKAGIIAEGARADLVMLDADPATDITATRRIDSVIIGGSILRKAARMEGMKRIRAAYQGFDHLLRETKAAAPPS